MNYPSDHVGADTWETDEVEAIVSLRVFLWWWWLLFYLNAKTEGAGDVEWMQIRISETPPPSYSLTHHLHCLPRLCLSVKKKKKKSWIKTSGF